ncbi:MULTISPECIES: bifunctional 2-keto-4-hydroxyglutarate aldolase/2-keto-3-deoxy-6-phosphogluconate aldolase [Heyndrickxia]|uniref:bifunctional 2-keto-4-hydroxyglutarate aldolase/2-keto-3-deoxy-6-phosphogluconate aldolase n=1 Tax=Heyndrickxia TaxID=2837504 RepID=UPI001B3A389D|nr:MULTISPECIES: bifunctional 2-keto-4-hydroxyglutarate aldolase/2-keto-3-deoxy-6-phosphogluconate aldolase [Heyndrickxia]MBQ4909829.1 bifunctional 2-keto-4-hydroxyglutarate aldolase/2-keto-3-deoxy-6-phosphogluconate aldolase [Heyndrickxia faecalis]MEC2224416.1 bifunctional 2-keto-4-hydroxyglutarate aldolase/2-keto-3-deoxy-6-phosphogluconate aldolase [Weizmannia sp. CD-2023]MED4920390.1 bifunctional 2-keto-4-hydroxyglutarate aldolase/2-keto-3-deoxy-6-phosphogluconate aldolase [Weizmannia sp. CD-
MKKMQTLQALEKNGIVAVLRADSVEKALRITDALIAGGINSIELTFTVPNADVAIKKLTELYQDRDDVLVGAGTVLDAQTAQTAQMAGAKFIVAPTFDPETAAFCNLYQIPYIPGCMTVNEMKAAMQAGAEVIKLFPSNIVGPAFVKDVKAPLPQLEIMPSGGISLDNMENWIKAGCKILGVGGSLLKPAETNDFAKVTETARAFVDKYQQLTEAVHQPSRGQYA